MGLERIRRYLDRLDRETSFLEDYGGGQLQTSIEVRGKAQGSGIGDIFTAPRRKL